MQDSEAKRIKGIYDNRKRLMSSQLYSFFNDAHLYSIQNRDIEILKILKTHNITSLENRIILDIGCGTGAELRNMIRYGANPINLHGIDILEDRIETARMLSPNIHFKCLDASEIPHDENSFDIVMQFTVFSSILYEHIKKHISQEMVRVSKTDGIIIWYDFYINNPKNPDVKGVKKREIYKLYEGCQIKLKRITLAPPIARIVAPHSKILCHLLDKLGFLNTHYIGVIRKLK